MNNKEMNEKAAREYAISAWNSEMYRSDLEEAVLYGINLAESKKQEVSGNFEEYYENDGSYGYQIAQQTWQACEQCYLEKMNEKDKEINLLKSSNEKLSEIYKQYEIYLQSKKNTKND